MHVRFIVEKHFLDEVDQLNDDGSAVPAYLAESIAELVPVDVRSNPYELELKEVNLSRVAGLVDIDFCLNKKCALSIANDVKTVPLTNEFLIIFDIPDLDEIINGFGIRLINKYWGMPHPSLLNKYQIILNYSLDYPKPNGFYLHEEKLVAFYNEVPKTNRGPYKLI